MENYSELRMFIDSQIAEILSKLGRRFKSKDFIEAFHRIYPNQYAEAVRFAGTYGKLHSWIARWYLSECERVRDLGLSNDVIIGVNGNATRNHRWEKL